MTSPVEQFINEASSASVVNIFVQNGRYYAKRSKGEITYNQEISDFTIEAVASHHRDDGIYREIIFVKGNSRSRKFLIPPSDMFDRFAVFCATCGDYSWLGSPTDAKNLWRYQFIKSPGKVIFEPECIGWQEDKKIFMFENIAFKGTEEIRPDASGTFWLDGTGIKPRSISASKSEVAEGLPSIITNRQLDLQELRSKLHKSMSPTGADVCLGWAVSVFYMEEVFEKYGAFPFLFLTGKRRSGKSTIAEWITNLFGFESAGRMWSDTTAVAMSRYLGYYSSLPLWLDEYRNDSKYASKTGMLRNVYNRQSSGKGTRDGFTIREAKIRGTVIITGEETPDDNALMTRCVIVQITERDRQANNFNWFTDNRRLLSNFAYQVMSKKALNIDKFMLDLEANKQALSANLDDRMAINQAVIATGFSLLFGDDLVFANSLHEKAMTDSESQEEESAISVFFNDISAMAFRKDIPETYWDLEDEHIYIYFHGLYNEWAYDYRKRKGEAPFKLQSIRSYLAEEPGFVSMSVNHRMKDNSQKTCVKFNVSDVRDYIAKLVHKA